MSICIHIPQLYACWHACLLAIFELLPSVIFAVVNLWFIYIYIYYLPNFPWIAYVGGGNSKFPRISYFNFKFLPYFKNSVPIVDEVVNIFYINKIFI